MTGRTESFHPSAPSFSSNILTVHSRCREHIASCWRPPCKGGCGRMDSRYFGMRCQSYYLLQHPSMFRCYRDPGKDSRQIQPARVVGRYTQPRNCIIGTRSAHRGYYCLHDSLSRLDDTLETRPETYSRFAIINSTGIHPTRLMIVSFSVFHFYTLYKFSRQ